MINPIYKYFLEIDGATRVSQIENVGSVSLLTQSDKYEGDIEFERFKAVGYYMSLTHSKAPTKFVANLWEELDSDNVYGYFKPTRASDVFYLSGYTDYDTSVELVIVLPRFLNTVKGKYPMFRLSRYENGRGDN